MKTLLGILAVLALSACGKTFQSDPAFLPYVQEFSGLLEKYGSAKRADNVILKFGAGDSIEGQCNQAPLQTPTIVINQAAWKNLTDTQRRLLVYHELGHCVLGRQHNETKAFSPVVGTFIPTSIMYPEALQAEYGYDVDPDSYTEELINP